MTLDSVLRWQIPKLALIVSEKIKGSWGMIVIFFRSCFRGVSLIFIPLTKISPDIPLLILNKADTRLLFPAPVLPTLRRVLHNYDKWFVTYYQILYKPAYSHFFARFYCKIYRFQDFGPIREIIEVEILKTHFAVFTEIIIWWDRFIIK